MHMYFRKGGVKKPFFLLDLSTYNALYYRTTSFTDTSG